MAVAALIVAAVLVVLIALGVVGYVTRELADTPSPAVVNLDEAVDWIADRLPFEVAARLRRDEVYTILTEQLEYLSATGGATEYGEELGVRDDDEDLPPVAALDDSVDAVVAAALERDEPVESVDVVVVLDLYSAYLVEVGAIGPEVDDA